MKAILLAAAGFLALSALPADATADAIEKAIKARQSFMQVTAFNLGLLGAMAKGEREYDAELASAAAKNLHALSLQNNGAMWPEGSSNDKPGLTDKTRALPVIWASYPTVAEKHKAWTDASADLAAVAGDGLDAMKSKIGPVGKSCGGCHKQFRAEKK